MQWKNRPRTELSGLLGLCIHRVHLEACTLLSEEHHTVGVVTAMVALGLGSATKTPHWYHLYAFITTIRNYTGSRQLRIWSSTHLEM